jgi:hypothetical protein
MGSNPTRVMYVYLRLFCVCVVLCVDCEFVQGLSVVQEILPTVYETKKLKTLPKFQNGYKAINNKVNVYFLLYNHISNADINLI